MWESAEYDDVTPHQYVDVTVSPRSTPRRPTPTPDGGHQMDGEILDFDVNRVCICKPNLYNDIKLPKGVK